MQVADEDSKWKTLSMNTVTDSDTRLFGLTTGIDDNNCLLKIGQCLKISLTYRCR